MVQGDMSASDVPRESVGDLSSEPAQVFGENRSVPLKFTGPLAGANIIHSIPGRVRLRVPTLKANPDLARGLQGLLSAQTGVIEVSVAPVCRSVTVVHDPARWTSESLCKLLQNLDREELDRYESAAVPEDATSSFAKTWLQPWRFLGTDESSPGSNAASQTGGPVTSGYWTVGYASMVVGLAMFAVPGVPGVPFLILSTYCFSKATIWKTKDEPEPGVQVPKAGQ